MRVTLNPAIVAARRHLATAQQFAQAGDERNRELFKNKALNVVRELRRNRERSVKLIRREAGEIQ